MIYASQSFSQYSSHEDSLNAFILTPTASEKPRINGAKVFGVRPGSPFIYNIPVSGNRPMEFEVKGLPDGLKVNAHTGLISGVLNVRGIYPVMPRVYVLVKKSIYMEPSNKIWIEKVTFIVLEERRKY